MSGKTKSLIKERAVKYETEEKNGWVFWPSIPRDEIEARRIKSSEEEVRYLYMTEEQFMEVAPDNQIWEFRYGEVIVHSPIRIVHDELDGFLFAIIFAYVSMKGLGRLFHSRVAVRLEPGLIYEPDIVFVKKNNKGKVEETRFVGIPDLVIEIISPSMIKHDRVTKFFDYEKFGVKEYWIFDPRKKEYDFYRNVKGRFQRELPQEGIYKSTEVAGFYLRQEWLENKKYWWDKEATKITYELIGKKDVIETIGEEEIIDIIGEKKLQELLKKRKE